MKMIDVKDEKRSVAFILDKGQMYLDLNHELALLDVLDVDNDLKRKLDNKESVEFGTICCGNIYDNIKVLGVDSKELLEKYYKEIEEFSIKNSLEFGYFKDEDSSKIVLM